MHAYSRGLATADDLRRVVDGLERYVARYVRRLRELGGRAYMAARRITRKPALDVLARAQEKAATEGVGGRSTRRDTVELLQNAIIPFLRPNGRLLDTCSRVEEMAALVVQRIHRRLRDLELRNFRLEEIGARLKEMAALDENDDRPGLFLRRLMSLVHVPLDPNLQSEGKPDCPWCGRFGNGPIGVRLNPCVGQRPGLKTRWFKMNNVGAGCAILCTTRYCVARGRAGCPTPVWRAGKIPSSGWPWPRRDF
jgi:hypothetical protein